MTPKRLLVVTTTIEFRHSSIPTAEKSISQLAQQSRAFTVDYVHQPEGKPAGLPRNATPEARAAPKIAKDKWDEQLKAALEKMSADSLKNYDGVIFANTTGDLPITDKEAFLAWLKSGKAFMEMHSAGDTFHHCLNISTCLAASSKPMAPRSASNV